MTGSWLLSRKVVKQAFLLSFQLLTWSSQQKSINTAEKMGLEINKLAKIKNIWLKTNKDKA